MNCESIRTELTEVARGKGSAAGLSAHLSQCAGCSRFLETQRALTAALQRLEAEADAIPAMPGAALLMEFDATHRSRKQPLRRWIPLAIAAALAGAVAIGWFAREKPVQQTVKSAHSTGVVGTLRVSLPLVLSPARRRAKQRARNRVAPFVQIPYTLPLDPYERSTVMRMEMPVAALIAAGVPVTAVNAGGRARADVLVGEDGRARAVRVISISND